MEPDLDAGPRRARARRKQERPRELLAAALDLFVERGYAGTRLDDVAARAGVAKGTLYLYFANKEELFKAVVRENIVRNIAEAQQAVTAYRGPTAGLLATMLRLWWDRVGQTPASGITKLVLAESGNFPEIARFYVEEVIEPAHQLMGSVIERGIRRREFRRVDVPTFVRVLTAPMVMLLLWRHSFEPCCHQRIDPQRYVDAHIDATLHALRRS
ncbi:MAG: TetR/AcrR family transcriptional regulator [Burkholderiaceae bacterium]|nr:TetR/AcrR family transcriptional regulator [Burkholderiaceae bacterium]MCX8006251.1 TetR/AcrR family transcriptional regulator [Burkholderiaceae bacterium]